MDKNHDDSNDSNFESYFHDNIDLSDKHEMGKNILLDSVTNVLQICMNYVKDFSKSTRRKSRDKKNLKFKLYDKKFEEYLNESIEIKKHNESSFKDCNCRKHQDNFYKDYYPIFNAFLASYNESMKKDIMNNFIKKSTTNIKDTFMTSTCNDDDNTHYFHFVKKLEEQLRKKTKEAEHYKTLYEEKKIKLEETECVLNVLKNVINLQKKAQINLSKVRPSSTNELDECTTNKDRKFYVYKNVQTSQHLDYSRIDKLENECQLYKYSFNQINDLLIRKSKKTQIIDITKIDITQPKTIIDTINMIIKQFNVLSKKHAQENNERLTQNEAVKNIINCFISEINNIFDKVCEIIKNKNFNLLSEIIKETHDNIYTNINKLTINDKLYKDELFCKLVEIKNNTTNIQFYEGDDDDIRQDELNKCLWYIENSFHTIIPKLVHKIFFDKSVSDTLSDPETNVDYLIVENFQESSPFSYLLKVINVFLNTIVSNSHSRYLKSVMLWSDTIRQVRTQLSDQQNQFNCIIRMISDFDGTNLSPDVDIKLISNIFDKKKNEIENLSNDNTRLLKLTNELKDGIQHINTTYNQFNIEYICTKLKEYLSHVQTQNIDPEVEFILSKIIVSFSEFLDKCHPTITTDNIINYEEIAHEIDKEYQSFICSLNKIANSLSFRMNELQKISVDHKNTTNKYDEEIYQLKEKLEESHLKINTLEDELDYYKLDRDLTCYLNDTSLQISRISTSIVEHSQSLIEKSHELKVQSKQQPMIENISTHMEETTDEINVIADNLDSFLDDLNSSDTDNTETKIIITQEEQDKQAQQEERMKKIDQVCQDLQMREKELAETHEKLTSYKIETDKKVNAFIDSFDVFQQKRNASPKPLIRQTPITSTTTIERPITPPDTQQDGSNSTATAQKSINPMGPIIHF